MHKIGDVAKLIGVKTHTIRFWEGKFDHIKSINNKSRTRYYNAFAIGEFAKIKELMYVHGLKLSGIIKMVSRGKIKIQAVKKMEKILNYQDNLFNIDSEIKSESGLQENAVLTDLKSAINIALVNISSLKEQINDILTSDNVK